MSAPAHLADSEIRRLAKVLRHVLDRETFTTMSDLNAAFADVLGRYRIFYEPADMDATFALVGSNRPLLAREPRPLTELRAPDPPPLNRRDASAVLASIQQRVGGPGPKSIQPLRATPESAIRQQADALRAHSEPLTHATRSRFSAKKFSKRR